MVRNYITHDSAYLLILFGMVWWEFFLFIFFKRTFWFWIDFSIFVCGSWVRHFICRRGRCWNAPFIWLVKPLRLQDRSGVRFPKASLANYGRNFYWTLLENDGTCDHSWLTMLSGNAPQDELLFLFLSAAQTHTRTDYFLTAGGSRRSSQPIISKLREKKNKAKQIF